MPSESQLIPVLREGVEVVKIILFKAFTSHLKTKHPDRDAAFCSRIGAAMINELFGTVNDQAEFVAFIAANRSMIEAEMQGIPKDFERLLIPMTDALRVQFLCDDLEGIGNESILTRARDLKILMVDRQVPLPKAFMTLVRKLGAASGVLDPESAPESSVPE